MSKIVNLIDKAVPVAIGSRTAATALATALVRFLQSAGVPVPDWVSGALEGVLVVFATVNIMRRVEAKHANG